MKKFFAMMMAIVMCVACMTACSSAPAANTGDGSTLVIGGVGPLTGDYANYGTSVRNGMVQAVEEINAAGGINGMMTPENRCSQSHHLHISMSLQETSG